MSSEPTKLPNVKYVLAASDLQEVLNYIAKRPLGEVVNVYKALERCTPLSETPATPAIEIPEEPSTSS